MSAQRDFNISNSSYTCMNMCVHYFKKGMEYKSTRNNDDFFLDVPRYTEDEDWSRTEGVVSLKDRTQEQLELKEKLLELF